MVQRMSRTIPNISKKFWFKFEREVTDVIQLALDYLLEKSNLPNSEDELNRILYFKMIRANFELLKQNDSRSECIPILEGRNQPNVDDVSREERKREHKRPDFQFQRTDLNSINKFKSAKQFIVECKRLGEPSSNNWILNENYILNGVKRFLDFEWRYGLDAPVGAMIGYIQSMEPLSILNEVNTYATNENIPKLMINSTLQSNTIHKLDQTLKRSFSDNEFRLKHFWSDIRV